MLSFVNQCDKDIEIMYWNSGVRVPAQSTVNITERRQRSSIPRDQLQRVTWKYADDPHPLHINFIELNQDWEGPGQQLCGAQVSYSSYASGFSMSSKYESLDPATGLLNDCRDPGAAVDYDLASCPTTDLKESNPGWCSSICTRNPDLCDNPADDWPKYVLNHAWAINANGKVTRYYDFNGNYVQYWCKDPERLPGDNRPQNVGSWLDCVGSKGLPMIFRITTCIDDLVTEEPQVLGLCRSHKKCPDVPGMCCPPPFGGNLACCTRHH